MARLSAEIWMLLLELNITPHFEYVASKENIADIFSRPDLVSVGEALSAKYSWKGVSAQPHLQALKARVQREPRDAWTHLWTVLYGGTTSVSCR